MHRERSERSGVQNSSRIDHLLRMLGDLSESDPSPAVREHLQILAARRLREMAEKGMERRARLYKPAFAAVLLLALGVGTGLVLHLRHDRPATLKAAAGVHRIPASPLHQPHLTREAPAAVPNRSPRPLNAHPSERRITMPLPYSNGAIDTGTGTTIRVAVSQSELVSMGFPINATIPDRRVVAELTLGDDGLPRALSLPLPLEVMKEKK